MKPLLLSCLPMIYFRPMVLERTMTLFDWLDVAATLGVSGTEIHNRTLPGYEPQEVDRVREEIEARRLRVSQVTTAPDFTHPDPDYREAQLKQVRADIDVAAALGATCVRLTAGQAHPGVRREDGIRWVMDSFERLLRYAEGKGVYLAYENHYKDYFWQYPDFSQRAEVFLEIVRRMRGSGLRVNFDTSNQVMVGEDPMAVLLEVRDLVVHVHCSDRVRPGEYQHAPAGEGVVDFPRIFAALHDAGYQGWLSVEYNGTEGLDGLRRGIDYVRRTWKEVAERGISS